MAPPPTDPGWSRSRARTPRSHSVAVQPQTNYLTSVSGSSPKSGNDDLVLQVAMKVKQANMCQGLVSVPHPAPHLLGPVIH